MFNNRKKILFAALFLFLCFCLYNAGLFLFCKKSNNKGQNQVIFIFIGSLSDRVLEASKLYHSYTSQKIVFGKTVEKDHKFLDSLGIDECKNTDKYKRALSVLKVPDSNIITLEAQNRSTIDESNLMLSYLEKHRDINKIAIVTSSYHSRRAYLILKDRLSTLNREVFIDVYPSTYSHVNLRKWWEKKEDAVHVFTEYAKLISFYTWEIW